MISHESAHNVVATFLEEVERYNSSDFAYEIWLVAIFGSYLTDKETLGDIDIAIALRANRNPRTDREFQGMIHAYKATMALFGSLSPALSVVNMDKMDDLPLRFNCLFYSIDQSIPDTVYLAG